MSLSRLKYLVFRTPKSAYFSIAVITITASLSLLQISGSSVGVYDYLLNNQGDVNGVIGEPRSVRSDEWAVNTPFVIAQSENNYPMYNHDIGGGQDMSVVVDVPYYDWSVLFRPQNLVFFLAPLELAFAFKWWFLLVALLLSVYYFILLLYPKRYMLASLLALFFAFSPFIQWWYQTITILPIAYGLIITISTLKMIRTQRVSHAVLWSILLTYMIACFTLIMYPAFQIGVAVVAATAVLAILAANKELGLLLRRRSIFLISISLLAASSIVGIFILQHQDTIKAIFSTVYPGARAVISGGYDPVQLTTWVFNYLLLDSSTATAFHNNQSESSSFLLVSFITTPILLGVWWITGKKIFSKQERILLFSFIALLIVIFIRMFIPFGDAFFNLIQFSKVPHSRLLIAIGLINLILLAICIGRPGVLLKSIRNIIDKYHFIIFALSLMLYSALAAFTVNYFSLTTVGIKEAILVVSLLSITTTLLVSPYLQPRYAGLILLCTLGFASAGLANPLHKGLSLPTSPVYTYIKEREKKDTDYWISNDQPYLSSIITATGAELQGGVNTYPQLELWQKHFPDSEAIFNRYAHVRFKIDKNSSQDSLELIQADSFRVTIGDCSPLLKTLRVRYIVSDIDLDELTCYPQKDTKVFGDKRLYIYSL